MNLPLPSVFNPKLSSDRLQIIANWLLEELHATEDDLTRSTDSGYSRGCTTFDRQKNRIIAEARSGKHPWLRLSNTAFNLVFTIDGVPCRFSNDDPSNPKKDAVISVNQYQMDFMEFVTKGEPGQFCFIIDRGHDGSADPEVVFLGFTPSHEVACVWSSGTVRLFKVVNTNLPKAVEVDKPLIAPKTTKKEDSGKDIDSDSNEQSQ